jgi:hypothetical protein
MSSIVIFWTELNYWRKSYSIKVMLLLGWSHRYENYTVVITIWLTAKKYPYLKWQWIFYFLRRCFLSFITAKTFYRTWLYIWVTGRVSVLLIFFRFLCCPFMSLRSEFRVVMSVYVFAFWIPRCDVRYDLRIKTMFGSSLPPVVCLVLLTLFVFVCV